MAGLRSSSAWWAAARQQGLVHSDAPTSDSHEPGPLLIGLAMLGALACLLPLGIFFALGLGERFLLGPGGLVTSTLALAVGGWLLRGYTQAFVNCVALVLWALGGGLLVFNLGDSLFDSRPGALLMCALGAGWAVGGAWLAQARWIQSVMGVCWAAAAYAFLSILESFVPVLWSLHLGSLLLAALWWWWLRAEPTRLAQPHQWWSHPRWAAFADAAVVGVLGSALWGFGRWWWLTSWAGVSDADAPGWGDVVTSAWILSRGIAAAATLLATVLLVQTWKSRGVAEAQNRAEGADASGGRLQALLYLAGALLAAAAWFSTSLAVVAVVAAGALLGARWRIAVLCAAIALFLLGQFYYYLGWPLAVKGLGLAVLGAALLLGLWLLRRATTTAPASQGAAVGEPSAKGRLAWLLAGAVLVFGLVNWDVRGKEQVIAYGQRILVPLVPVDPRSLMQGDYMALNFSLPQEVSEGLKNVLAPVQRVRASVDAQGVATVLSLADSGAQPGRDEVILPLKQLKGRWVLVTDAYFFPEGQGAHFAPAKFGDFRVLPDGRALLVGLADSEGRAVEPLPVRSIWEIAPVSGSTEATEATEAELTEAPAIMDAEPASAEAK